jgi:hypothetical protein
MHAETNEIEKKTDLARCGVACSGARGGGWGRIEKVAGSVLRSDRRQLAHRSGWGSRCTGGYYVWLATGAARAGPREGAVAEMESEVDGSAAPGEDNGWRKGTTAGLAAA